MSSLDLRVLVLERQRWQLQQDLDVLEGALPAGGAQPLDATLTAMASLVGTPNTLPYFTATEVMALTAFSAYSRSLLALGDAGSWRSTLGLGSGATITASGTATQVAYWSGATTLTSTGNLLVTGTGIQTGRLGVAYAPPSNVWLRSGHGDFDTMRLGGSSDTVARWPLDCPGQGLVGTLGVYYGPDNAVAEGVDFRTYRARIDLLGVGYRADSGYALRAGSTYLDALTVNGTLFVPNRVGDYQYGFYTELNAAGGTGRLAIICNGTAPSQFNGSVAIYGELRNDG